MSRIAQFRVTGPATAGRSRAAGLLDLLVAVVVSMLVVPQPVVRGALMSGGASPASIALFVGSMLLAALVVLFAYLSFSAVTWGRTPTMYLLDLGLEAPSRPTTKEAVLWAFGWACAAVPALLGVRAAFDPENGWPARFSGLPTRSAATD